MKARMFILTTGAAVALVVPAAQAASNTNRLFQTRVHTILAERNGQQSTVHAKRAKNTKSTQSTAYAKTEAGYYQALIHTVGADGNVGPIGLSRPVAVAGKPMPPQSPASSRR